MKLAGRIIIIAVCFCPHYRDNIVTASSSGPQRSVYFTVCPCVEATWAPVHFWVKLQMRQDLH